MSAMQASIVLGRASSQIVVDGKDLANGCRAIELYGEAADLPRLTLHLQLPEITVDDQVRAWIPDGTREALIALGWTPPPGEGDS